MGKITVKHATSYKAGTTDYTVQWFKVFISSRTKHCRTVFQNYQDKTPRASPDEQFIMEYPPGLPQNVNNDVEQAIGRRQRAYETKRTNNEETVAEYIEAKRQVIRIVKQEKPTHREVFSCIYH